MVVKVLVVLAWVSGVLFFWASWAGRMFWGFDAGYWAWSVVVLVLLAKASKNCGCCGMSKMMEGGKGGMCSHEGGCKCGDCGRCQ